MYNISDVKQHAQQYNPLYDTATAGSQSLVEQLQNRMQNALVEKAARDAAEAEEAQRRAGETTTVSPAVNKPNYLKPEWKDPGTGFGTGNFAGNAIQQAKTDKMLDENLITEEQASGNKAYEYTPEEETMFENRFFREQQGGKDVRDIIAQEYLSNGNKDTKYSAWVRQNQNIFGEPYTRSEHEQDNLNNTIAQRGEQTARGAFENIGNWFKDVGKAAATGTASSLTGAFRAGTELGNASARQEYQSQLQTDAASLFQQLRSQQFDVGHEDDYDDAINAIQNKLKQYDKLLGEGVYDQVMSSINSAMKKASNPDADIVSIMNNLTSNITLPTEGGAREKTVAAASQLSNELQAESQAYTESAKARAGNTAVGNLATTAAVNAGQMIGDAAMNLIAPGTSLPTMGVRVFGSSAQKAEAKGASLDKQLLYGAVKGGISMLTEKLTDGLAGAYGKGEADDLVEAIVGRLAKSDTHRTALRMFFSGVGEATEEVAEALTDPVVDAILDGIKSIPGGYNKEWLADAGYSALVGFVMGEAGGAVDIATGKSAEANAKLTAQEQARVDIQNNLIGNGMDVEKAGKASDILAKIAAGKTISKSESEYLKTVGNIDTSAPVYGPPNSLANSVVTPRNGRNYEGVGNKAQNPEKAAAKSAQTEQTIDYAQQKAQAEAKLAHAQAAYEASSNDPEMQPVLLQQVEQAQQELDEINAKIQADTPNMPSEHSTTSHTSESTITPETTQESAETPSGELNSEPETEEQSGTQNQENWSGDEVPTQSTFHDQLTDEEKTRDDLNPENDTHVQHHDEEVDSFAQNRITEKGHDGARDDLMSRDPAEWDDVDVRTAQMLLTEELENARQPTGEEQDAAYRRIAELKNAYNKQGTEAGRSLRQRQRFGGTAEDIISEAISVLYGAESQNNLQSMTTEEKSDLMNEITDYARRREARQPGDTASLIDMIKEINEKRRTTGLLKEKTGKLMSWFLDLAAKQEGGEEFLNEILGQQIRGLANDQVKTTAADAVNTIRFNNMLSNFVTIVRNFVANPVMDLSEALSNDLGLLADVALSKFTGTRSIAWDSSWFSGAKRRGTVEALIRSVIEEGLDAPLGTTGKYEEVRQGRTFKMSGGPVERILSTWSKWLNYGLKSTDEMMKGGTRDSVQQGLDRLHEQGKITDKAYQELSERAGYVAKERTLQKDDGVAGELANFKRSKGPLGWVARQIMPFAQVPANATVMSINYTPAGIMNSLLEIGKAINTVRKGGTLTADQQAKIVTSIGRNVNASALLAASFALAMKGIISTAKDDDKNKKALDKAEGLSGTQLNLSALGRWINGEDTTLQADDELIGLGFLEYLNASMALGAALAEDYRDNGEITPKDFAIDNLGAVMDSVLSLPAVSQISSAYDAYNYSTADTEGGKAADALVALSGSIASGYTVPNWLRGVAKATDPYERVTYTGDNFENNINYLKSGIPGLRETLPIKVDPLGNDVKRTDNQLMNALNSLVLPGEVRKYTPHDVTSELARVSEATGTSLYPDRNAPKKIKVGDETYELSQEEQSTYMKEAGSYTDKYLKALFKTPYYKQMSEELQGEAIKEMESLAEDAAKQAFLGRKGVKYSSDRTALLGGAQKSGTTYDKVALNPNNLVTYTAYKIGFDDARKNGDYTGLDSFLKQYSKLDKNIQVVARQRIEELDNLLEYKKNGMNAATYFEVKDTKIAAQSDLDENANTSATVRLLGLSYANIPEREKAKIVNNIEDYIGSNGKAAYNALTKYGITSSGVYDFFNTALNCKTWKNTNQPVDAGGKLSADATAYALSQMPNLTDTQREAIFNEIKGEISNKYNDWKNYTYASEIAYINRESNKATYSVPKKYITTDISRTGNNPLYGGNSGNSNYLMSALGIAG